MVCFGVYILSGLEDYCIERGAELASKLAPQFMGNNLNAFGRSSSPLCVDLCLAVDNGPTGILFIRCLMSFDSF